MAETRWESQAKELRGRLRVHSAEGRRGYPPALRAQVARVVRAGRAEGRSWRTCAETFGVSTVSLRRWCDESPGLRPVSVVPNRSATEIAKVETSERRLVLPSGAELRGLSLADAIALAQALR